MTRRTNMEVRIMCQKCNDFTESTEPITIKRFKGQNFDIQCKCVVCNKLKRKRLNKLQRKLLPDEVINMPENSEVVNNINRDGGILPILPLLGAIFAGVSALTGVGGTVASAVINSKKANEEKRHNEAMEQIANNVATGKGWADLSESEKYDTSVKYLQGKGFQIFV